MEPLNRNILLQWIEQASLLEPGESVFLHAESREHARKLVKQFQGEVKILSHIDPIRASRLKVMVAIRDQMYWVEIKKIHGSPLIGFKKDKDGKTIRVEISDPDRARRLQCMKEDGYTLEEVEDMEGELNDEEKEVFKR
jgi:DNA-dependent RNA polymerase auxiliary subunit epsilon